MMLRYLQPIFGGAFGAITVLLTASYLVSPPPATPGAAGTSARTAAAASLRAVRSWHYQLQFPGGSTDQLQRSGSDMLVIDYSRSGKPAMVPFTREQILPLKKKPDGGRRLVIAYLSIGEAEEYRYYWRKNWNANRPDWMISENCTWPRNHLIRFWSDEWREIIFRAKDSYLSRIMAAGFDGVYLDRIDVYWDLRERYPDMENRMIDFVSALASVARARDPGFIIIAQNAEGLVKNSKYRAAIDGIAKEDLLFGVGGTGKPNNEDLVRWSKKMMHLARQDGKALFAAEYLDSRVQIGKAGAKLDVAGIVATFPPRSLDGSNPVKPKPASGQGKSGPAKHGDALEYGTPEYSKAHCNGVFHRTG